MAKTKRADMKILAVANQKGGVGKSTTAVHLAFRASELGLRTLVVDIDEGDISTIFQADHGNSCLVASELFSGRSNRSPRFINDDLSIIEWDIAVLDVDASFLVSMEGMEEELAKAASKVSIPRLREQFAELAAQGDVIGFRDRLRRFSGDFDLCVIDTGPNLQRRMISALVAADAIVSPFTVDPFSLARFDKLIKTIANVRERYNPRLTHLGFLANKVNTRSENELSTLPELRKIFGNLTFKEMIASRSCVGVAMAEQRPVWQGARSGNQRQAAKEMRAACDAVLTKLGVLK